MGSFFQDTSKERLLLGALALLLGYFYLVYHAFPTTNGKSLSGWTWYACNSQTGFLHGRFIPIAFIAMAVLAWKKVRDMPMRPNAWGIVAVGFGLLLYLMAVRTVQPRLALMGIPFLISGLVLYVAGYEVMKHFLFPAFFWVFAIPVPGLETALTGGLQILTTQSCYHVGVLLGMDLTLDGSNIYLNSDKNSNFNIAEGCSGIRSLMALTMIAAVFGNYTQKPLWKKALVFASALPLAIIGNFGRIFTILVIASLGFEDFAKRTYHDWAGLLLFFPIALSGLYLIDYLLNIKDRRRKRVKKTVKTSSKKKGENAPA
ncbi:MAG: exosortase/archaeosortase family protein [Verrucomicrobiaceae bacterium]